MIAHINTFDLGVRLELDGEKSRNQTQFNMPPDAARAARYPSPGEQAGISSGLIKQVVEEFYKVVRTDAVLGPVFNGRIAPERWPAHISAMHAFWSSLLLLTGEYKGRPTLAHTEMNLSLIHYQRWLSCFEDVVARNCAPEAARLFMERANRIAGSFLLASTRGAGAVPDAGFAHRRA